MMNELFGIWIGIAVTLMSGAGLAFMTSEKTWRGLTKPGSRWSNQASTSALLLFGGLGVLGAGLVLMSGSDVWFGWRSTQWPARVAMVQTSRLVEVKSIRSGTITYHADVTYQYNVDGVTYTGGLISYGTPSTVDREFVEEEIATRYAPGAMLNVFVDPANPTRAVIEPGVEAMAGVRGGLGAAFVVISVWQLTMLLRDWHGDGSAPTKKSRRRRAA
jgi:hypothetical protein